MGEPWRGYVLDPDDPRAPSQELWDAMSPAERTAVLQSLPSDLPISESAPPEGDTHFDEVVRTRDVLRGYFGRTGRSVYVANNLAVYYPGEAMFAPDLMAVLDVPLHARDHWTVSAEGKGLDVALAVLWSGRRAKDPRENVRRYAQLGIPEYFVFDRRRLRLEAYRLPDGAATEYLRIVPQSGRYTSRRLDLELAIEGEKLRFFHAGAPLPESAELIARLDASLNEAILRREMAEKRAEDEAKRAEDEAKRAEDEAKRAEDEAKRAEDEAKRAEELRRQLADALAELERLRNR